MKGIVYGALTAWVFLACVCIAAPEPAVVQKEGQWTLNVTFEHPQQIVLPWGAAGKPIRFWYTILSVTNETGDDVEFYPKCDLMTDTFQIIPAGRNVSPYVFAQIQRRHESKYPLLESLEQAGDRILQGEDNAKDIAIIWPDFDTQAKAIKLFITGLSNETAMVDHPIIKAETGQPIKVFLRKTLELSYDLQGDPTLRYDLKLIHQDKRWIMR